MTAPGTHMVPVRTHAGTFQVFTRQAGESPDLKVLLLHGGPGATHEYLLDLEQPLVAAGAEVHHYDQLGSHHSDQPDDTTLWEIDRFVDEVHQVRAELGMDASNSVLYGQSWGGVLGIEYALAHPGSLRGLVVSNMMASVPAYNRYAEEVIKPGLDPAAVAEIERMEAEGETEDPRYEELLLEHHYVEHVLRLPLEEWPSHVVRSFDQINKDIYVPIQGPSELGASGKLLEWDRFDDLARIDVPTLVIGAEHDTMDPAHLRAMAERLPRGRYRHCPDGSHLAMVDDHDAYVAGLTAWLDDLAAGRL